jgi:integrase
MPTKLTKRTVEASEPRPSGSPYEVRDSELKGFLVRVEPGGAKTFFFDYRHDGRRNRFKLGSYPNLSADGAREQARIAAGDAARGVDLQARKKAQKAESERRRHSTLAKFLERYESWEKTHRKVRNAERIRAVFPEKWQSLALNSLNSWLVESWRRDAHRDGKKPTTINRDTAALKGVLSKAVEWGLLDRSPLYNVRPMKTDPIGRVRFLTADEEKRLRRALRGRDQEMRERRRRFNEHLKGRGEETFPPYPSPYADHLEPLILLLLNTGMRFGEALQLRHRDVNLKDRLITVAGETAKSGRTRVIPMNTEARQVLHALSGSAGTYVFSGDRGNRLTTIKSSWTALRKAAGISDFRLHDLRHTFASRVKRGGVDLYAVQRLLGHSTPIMTQRYAHLQPDDLRAAVEKMTV